MSRIKKLYPFLIREEQLKESLNYLKKENNAGTGLFIQGDSGTGKTFFSKELLYRLSKNENFITLYVDISNDIHESSHVFSYILQMVLLQSKSTRDWPVSIPKEKTYDNYTKLNTKKSILSFGLINIVSGLMSFFGLGKLTDNLNKDGSTSIENDLQNYLKWLTSTHIIAITIDNIQFLNEKDRINLETIFERINHNIKIIIIDRTIHNISTLEHPLRFFSQNKRLLSLSECTKKETFTIVESMIKDSTYIETISDDIYIKSNGLFKDIQYCIDSYLLEKEKGIQKHVIEGLLSTIDKLPLMHRQFLLIASLLNGGVKKEYALNVIKRIYQKIDIGEINKTLEELVLREYLKINSIRKDRILPAHERIVNVMQELVDDETQEEVRYSLIKEFEQIINSNSIEESETYILHCFLGLQTTQELIKNLNYISRLLDSQYRQENFRYIITFAEEMEELVYMLPEVQVFIILDSFQKDSSFDKGIKLIDNLYRKDIAINKNKLEIFRFKFLIQSYHYEQAIDVSKNIENSTWKSIYLINIFQALEKSDKAIEEFNNARHKDMTEEQAILLRNTITLFPIKKAKDNLIKSKIFFERVTGSEFRIATIENNMGIVYLNNFEYGDANRYFNAALKKFQKISSGEMYQALINIGVYYAKINNFKEALVFFKEAKLHVPSMLLLDKVKIDLNIAVMDVIIGNLSLEEFHTKLNYFNNKIKGIQMPYLRHVITQNINMIVQNKIERKDQEIVSIITTVINNSYIWHIIMSVHWRY